MRRVLFVLAGFVVAACSSTAIPFTPAAFERPGDVAFVCFDTNQTPIAAVSRDACRRDETGTAPAGFVLHGLVLQTARGEIATIDLVANRLLDSDTSVPGYTFLEAGDLPTALVAPANPASDGADLQVYVANSGSRDIWSIPARRFRTPEYGVDPWSSFVTLEGSPSALAFSPDEHFLFAAVPSRGSVYQIEIAADGTLGASTEVVLGTSVPVAPAGSREDEYARECTTGTVLPAGERPMRTPETLGAMPQPSALVVDATAATPVLLVADAALPVIHRIPISAAGLDAEIDGVATELPTRDIATTPVVPTAVDGSGAARYLYALDVQGDVMAIDYTEGATFGQILSVGVAEARSTDRMAFLPLATTIEVITPGFDPENPTLGLCAPPAEVSVGANRLHGVFLSVGFADGTVRLADIYDLDAPCRGEAGACVGGAGDSSTDIVAFIRRNRPRIGEVILTEIGTTGSVAFQANGATWPITVMGETASTGALPELEARATCANGFVDAYPRDEMNMPLICTLADPWNALVESWTAQYEGIVVGGDAGRFSTGNTFLAEAAFCNAGVLGSGNLPASDASVPESLGPGLGDQLVITSLLPPGETRAECQAYVATDGATGIRLPLAFEITRAFADRLELGEMIGRPDIFDSARSIDALRDCFGELVSFSVRTHGAYIVSGSRSGAPSRVVSGDGGACTVDTTLDVALQNRAFGGVPFANRRVAFTISALDGVTNTTSLHFNIGGVPLQLGADVGLLPTEMHFSDVDGYLYVVDTASQALVRLQMNEFRVLNTFR